LLSFANSSLDNFGVSVLFPAEEFVEFFEILVKLNIPAITSPNKDLNNLK